MQTEMDTEVETDTEANEENEELESADVRTSDFEHETLLSDSESTDIAAAPPATSSFPSETSLALTTAELPTLAPTSVVIVTSTNTLFAPHDLPERTETSISPATNHDSGYDGDVDERPSARGRAPRRSQRDVRRQSTLPFRRTEETAMELMRLVHRANEHFADQPVTLL